MNEPRRIERCSEQLRRRDADLVRDIRIARKRVQMLYVGAAPLLPGLLHEQAVESHSGSATGVSYRPLLLMQVKRTDAGSELMPRCV